MVVHMATTEHEEASAETTVPIPQLLIIESHLETILPFLLREVAEIKDIADGGSKWTQLF